MSELLRGLGPNGRDVIGALTSKIAEVRTTPAARELFRTLGERIDALPTTEAESLFTTATSILQRFPESPLPSEALTEFFRSLPSSVRANFPIPEFSRNPTFLGGLISLPVIPRSITAALGARTAVVNKETTVDWSQVDILRIVPAAVEQPLPNVTVRLREPSIIKFGYSATESIAILLYRYNFRGFFSLGWSPILREEFRGFFSGSVSFAPGPLLFFELLPQLQGRTPSITLRRMS